MRYLVIENAGYEGERIVGRHDTYRKAVVFMECLYPRAAQRENMHVDIARERFDGSITFEL